MSSAQNLAREVADLKRRLASLERAGRLSNASIDSIDEETGLDTSVDLPGSLALGVAAGASAAAASAVALDIRNNGSILVKTDTQSYDLRRTVAALTQFTGTMQAFYGTSMFSLSSTSYSKILADAPDPATRVFDRTLVVQPIADGQTFGDDSLIDGVKAWVKVTANLSVIADSTTPGGRMWCRLSDMQGNYIKTYGLRLPANGHEIFTCTWMFEYTHMADLIQTGGLSLEARLASTSGGSYTIDGTNSLITIDSTIRDWSTVRV